jgi:hypothetical protein
MEDDRFAPIYRNLSVSPRLFGLPVLASLGLLAGGLTLFMFAMFWYWVAGALVIMAMLIVWVVLYWVATLDRTTAPRWLLGLSYRVPTKLTSFRRSTQGPEFIRGRRQQPEGDVDG